MFVGLLSQASGHNPRFIAPIATTGGSFFLGLQTTEQFGYTVGMTAPRPPTIPWNPLSRRSLRIYLILCAILCSWLAVKTVRIEREREAAVAIEKLGGKVRWIFSPPSGPAWLQSLQSLGGDNISGHVIDVDLSGTQATDTDLVQLNELPQLLYLWLYQTKVTDAGLEHLAGLTQLHDLRLASTQITDAGLEHLKGMNQLRSLDLGRNQITDGGLKHLRGLSKLDLVFLPSTQITDVGLEHLKGMNQLRSLKFSCTQITDAGLQHLDGLTKLTRLDLKNTKVTDNGVKKLRQALPNCEIIR